MDELHAAMGSRLVGGIAGPAIHRHVMTAFDEAGRELLGEGLEAAVVAGDTSGAEDGDPKARAPHPADPAPITRS